MAQVKSARFTKEQENAIEDMVERDKADNESEAHRMLVNAGMREYGYENGQHSDTVLKNTVKELSNIFTLVGLVGLAFTFAYPVGARLPSFALLAFGVMLYSVGKALEQHEPKVSKRIKRLFGGSA
jgi:Fe2+ transport system protein B